MPDRRKNLNRKPRTRGKYPLLSIVGTLMTGISEFFYASGLLGRHSTSTDFGLMGLLMLPLFVGFYCDRGFYRKIQ